MQTLNLLDAAELYKLGHNSAGYLHRITEAVKLAFADREAYFGDPRIIDVPIEAMLSRDYAKKRRELIRPDKAWPQMPPAGDPRKLAAERMVPGAPLVPERAFSRSLSLKATRIGPRSGPRYPSFVHLRPPFAPSCWPNTRRKPRSRSLRHQRLRFSAAPPPRAAPFPSPSAVPL